MKLLTKLFVFKEAAYRNLLSLSNKVSTYISNLDEFVSFCCSTKDLEQELLISLKDVKENINSTNLNKFKDLESFNEYRLIISGMICHTSSKYFDNIVMVKSSKDIFRRYGSMDTYHDFLEISDEIKGLRISISNTLDKMAEQAKSHY